MGNSAVAHSIVRYLKEDFVMRNKQVSGAGQTGLKRKQNDDRVSTELFTADLVRN